MSDVKNIPQAQALKDYKNGGGFDDNPYPEGSREYLQYQKQMHDLFYAENKAAIEEMRAAI